MSISQLCCTCWPLTLSPGDTSCLHALRAGRRRWQHPWRRGIIPFPAPLAAEVPGQWKVNLELSQGSRLERKLAGLERIWKPVCSHNEEGAPSIVDFSYIRAITSPEIGPWWAQKHGISWRAAGVLGFALTPLELKESLGLRTSKELHSHGFNG